MKRIRFYFALWASKLARAAIRLMGRNASFWPGKIALRLCPDFIGQCGRPETVVSVTGTNGKTTCCNMLIDFFTRGGETVLNNRLGSNTNAGIASALSQGNTWGGKARQKLAVLEVDERSSRLVYPYIRPDYILITDLFRDSILRNANAEFIAGILDSSIPENTKLVLNGDDLISSRVALRNRRVYYGIGRLPTDTDTCRNIINDVRVCPVCQSPLASDYVHYCHIGRVRCPKCGFASPEPDYFADSLDFENSAIHIAEKDGGETYHLAADSIFNAYDVLGVIALLREMGHSRAEVKAAMEEIRIVGTRYLTEQAGDVSVVDHLAKGLNPVACSLVFDWLSRRPGKKELILLLSSDPYELPENVTWLYDTDFEFLNSPDITRIVVGGKRLEDYRLRLLIAGVPEDKIVCCASEAETVEHLELAAGETVYFLHDFLRMPYNLHLGEQIRGRIRERVAGREEAGK